MMLARLSGSSMSVVSLRPRPWFAEAERLTDERKAVTWKLHPPVKNEEPILQILLEAKKITEADIERALADQREPKPLVDELRRRGRCYGNSSKGFTVIDLLLMRDVIDGWDLGQALAHPLKMDFVDAGKIRVSWDVKAMVSRDVMERFQVIPLMVDDGKRMVAVADPRDREEMEALRRAIPHELHITCSGPVCFQRAYIRYYGASEIDD
jgi:hypothetical protein